MAAVLALATAVAGLILSAVPTVKWLEDELGLRWLFSLRGTLAPPSNVVIVNIAAARVDRPRMLQDWPRSMHAHLLERLVEEGASAIAFDVMFLDQGISTQDDQLFSDAIERSRRVVLAHALDVYTVGTNVISRRESPIPVLANAAQGLAPVPVPEVPLVVSFWTFISTPGMNDEPALPSVLLQIHGLPALEPFVRLLQRAGLRDAEALPTNRDAVRTHRDLLRFMQTVRHGLQRDGRARSALPSLAAAITSPEGDLLRALATLYTADDTAYINFYGPPRTICTVSYDAVVAGVSQPGCPLRGSLVLVGGAAGTGGRADQPDTHYTVFDQPGGEKLSGVELHATAVANLLTGTALRMPGVTATIGLLIVFGGLLGATGYYVRTRRRLHPGAVSARFQAGAALVALVGAYAFVVAAAFQTNHLVLPLVVPLAIQFPMALILGLVLRPVEYEDQVEAVCLATDAAGSTAIGQALPHGRYVRLMSDYNAALCAPVWARGGATLEPQGDGFICLWCAPGGRVNAATRQQACSAALEMVDASLRFSRRQSDGEQLPTRVGLNVGLVTIYSDADRGVFKAFGDALNVAARLRDLNVELGTHVLACDRVVEGLGRGLTIRPVKSTLGLKGVTHPRAVFEVAPAHVDSLDAPSGVPTGFGR